MKKRYKFLTALIFSSAIGFSQTATLPLYEDFESESQGYTSCASSTTINLASTVFSNGTGDDSDWSPDKGGTVSSNTGPTVNNGADHNPGTSSGYYLYIETSGCYNKTTNLESVYMDWSSESGVKIDFWYHMYGSAMGTMHFDIRQGNGAWQNDFITSWTDNQDVWQLQSISVFDPNYVGRDSVQIRVRGISGTSFSSDMALDDFSITPISGLDIEATALASPSLPTCAGSQLFELTVTNMGTNVVTSFNSYFKYNGSLVDTDVFSGTLNPGASTTITFNSQVVAAGSNLVQMYTASPNGKADGNLTNDTLNLSLSPALSGVYTIDANGTPSTTTYTSFQSLINDLSSNGICGPVTINVAAGTYSTPVTIESINGTSATNTITFDGGDSSSTIITHNSNGQYGTVLFNGVSYITFKNFGIVSTGTSNAVGVMFVNSEHCTVSNCEISVPTSSNSTVMPVTYSGSTTSTTSAGSNHYNFLTDNKLDGGYYGVRLYGTSSDYGKYNQVLNNVMTNIYYYGIYTYYQDSTVISGNAIDVTAASNVNADGVYAYYTFNADFIGNTISAPDYGLYVSQITTVRPARTKKTRLINNMVYSSGDYGVYLYGVDSVDFLHNTVVNEGTNPAVYFYTSTSTSYDPIDNYDIRNNIMYSTTAEAIEFLNCTDAIADNFDNNLFYTGGSVLVKNGTSTYADLSAYQTANGLMNINSVEGDPGFLSSTDLHVAGALANDAGDNSVGITVDIDGDTRPYSGSTIVDIGADEFTPPSCLQPSSLSESNITASAASLTWTENNAATQWQVSYGLSGFTAGNGTQVVTSSNPQNITALLSGTTYDWYVRTSCGRNNSSAWAGPNTFTTLAAPVTIPYYQDFEGTNPLTDFTINIGTDAGLQIDASSNCTGTNSLHMTGGTSSGWSGSSGATGTSTTQAWVTNSTKISDASLNVDATSATNNLTLSFDLKQTWSYGPGYSWARILVNGTQISPDYHPTTASSDACSKIIFDLSAYAGTSFELTFQSSMKYDVANSAPGDNAYFDNIVIEEVTCPLSSNLLTSNLTSTSVDLAWTDGGTATSWEISYGTTGFTAGNGTQVTTSTNPHSLTGLSSSTTYDWYVRAICGQNDFSSWSSVNSFTTLCAPLTAPVLDDVEFHTATTNLTTSLCWTATANNTTNKWNISGNGGTPSSGTGPLSANSGTKFFYFEASGGTAGNEAYLESPLVDLSPLTTPRLTFYYHMFGDGRNIMADLYVEVHNGTSYVLVDSIIGEQQANQADPFYKRAIDLSAFSGISKVRFTAKWNGAQWGDVSIDDIAVEETPSCIAPSSLSTSNLTSTSVDLAWTENNSATSWKIEYGASGFTQGTGTIITTSSNPYSFNGLTTQTAYDWYVRSDCGGGSDTSLWSSVNSFTTPCNAFTTPYFEGFETGYTHNTAVAGCLSQESTSGAGMWTANNTLTTYNRTPNSGSWNAFLQYNNEDWIFIPISLTGGISYTADVYARQDGSTTTNSNVGISYGSSNTIAAMTNTIVSPVGIDATYQLITGTFTPGSSGVYYIGIKGYMNGSPWYISIDDIAVYESPSCVSPTSLSTSNLTSTSVDLAWTENNSATSWIIEYGTSGFTQGTGTIVTTSSNPHSLSGLTAQTTYDWYVRADCGGGDTSAWSAVNSFTTLCATVTLPYTEGFENGGAIPNCWNQGSGNLEDWKFGSGSAASYGPTSGFGGSGYYAWIDDSSPHNTNTSIETPLIDLGAATHPGLEFYLWSESHSSASSFLLHVAIDSGNGFNTVQTLDIENTGWEKQRIYLGDYAGKTIQVRFTGEEVGTGFQKDIAIDNISIADGYSCESPINLRTQFSSDTSTTLRWDKIDDAIGYKIRWKQAGAPNFGPVHFRHTNTPIYDIDGLTPSTNYVFVVTANCKAGYGEPSVQRFRTLDAPCAIPTGMFVGGISHNQARFAWDTMPGAKKYRVRYRVQGTTPWAKDVAYAGRTKLWLTGLNPATTYEWQAKTVCEYSPTASGTRWSGIQTFTTGLNPQRIKFSENKDVNEIELSIYPNPNNGSFNFELFNNGKVNGQIQVFDVVGKLVYQENIQSESGVVKKQIDLNVDAQGIYFLKFSNGDFIQNERIIIQ